MTKRSMPTLRVLAFTLAACLGASAQAAMTLDPDTFTSLGTLSWTSGDYTIDTDALTIVDDAAPGTPLFTGVVDDQESAADSTGGVPGPLGIPEIAVFTFDAVTIDGTANVSIVGTRALALLSQGDMLIDRTLSVDGGPASVGTSTTPGTAGSGGFAGGGPALDGIGPGGGGGHTTALADDAYGGGGGFGGPGDQILVSTGAAGPIYGNLREHLQGGSGGGGATSNTSGVAAEAAGGGGGGAIELAAAGALTIGSGGVVSARGGGNNVDNTQFFYTAFGAAGSGGGIRLSGAPLTISGVVRATTQASGSPFGGGGRVLRAGDLSGPTYIVGGTLPAASTFTAGVDVSGSGEGWITAAPATTIVPSGTSHELATVVTLQSPSTSQPGVEFVTRDLQVVGTVTVPAGGVTYRESIELLAASSSITGADPLVLGASGEISGTGTVGIDVTAESGARIVAVGEDLTFSGSLTNEAGANTSCVAGSLTVPGDGAANDDGIVNLGTLNLVDCTVNGDVRSPAGSTINVAGTVVFNGLVSGAGTFSGTTNEVVFNGGYSPGD